VRRGLALVAAVALVAGLAWAWWPQDGRYRPVRPYEGGTVLDALPAARSSALADGGVGDGLTIWPGGGSLPTADHPVLALVLTPAAGSSSTGAPTWVFPFDRPLPPGEGDNQALAVNTQDGAVRYSVSFSLVWADGDTAVNRNEAYALASCTGCRTVAVAFQVVLLVGDVDVVVPQNLSAAVNYGCVQCVTYALATQLVVSLPDRLDEQASRDLAAVWDRLRAFGDQIEDVPLSELQDRLTDFEDQIAAIVQRSATGSPAQATSDDAGTTSGRPAASTSAEPEPTGGAAETSGSPSSTGTATDSGTATTDSSADTTTDPSTSAATSSGG
jgi:putative peptide zinc metalloprotease protein